MKNPKITTSNSTASADNRSRKKSQMEDLLPGFPSLGSNRMLYAFTLTADSSTGHKAIVLNNQLEPEDTEDFKKALTSAFVKHIAAGIQGNSFSSFNVERPGKTYKIHMYIHAVDPYFWVGIIYMPLSLGTGL